jgi:hypothetical protein
VKVTGEEGLRKFNALLQSVDNINTNAVNGNGVIIKGGNITSIGLDLS